MSLPLNQVIVGDCGDVMAYWPGNSVDCVVTDPPYRIGFMGKSWDRALPPRRAFRQIYRVLKPGALAFIMSSPRQDVLWRMLSMLDEIGFELRQSFISWIYKTGFPKAFDVSQGIDRKLGLERIKSGELNKKPPATNLYGDYGDNRNYPITEPASDLAKQWEGWKSQTGLKPALECILMVNKPRSESTIVDNVLKWGTGVVNVDACRIPFQNKQDIPSEGFQGKNILKEFLAESETEEKAFYIPREGGRFPANLLISNGALDTGKITQTDNPTRVPKTTGKRAGSVSGNFGIKSGVSSGKVYSDSGDQSRYFDLDAWAEHHGFLDVAKPSRAERDFGLGYFPLKPTPIGNYEGRDLENPKNIMRPGMQDRKARNIHPTCKPVKLMAYLIELGCPPGGVVLDPFLGSGTTCISAKQLRRKWIGIEINTEYAEIAEARINIRGPLDQFMEADGPGGSFDIN